MIRDMRILTVLVISASMAACSRTGDPVHYVLPDGFTGYFVIVAGDPNEGSYLHNGKRHVYTIPPSGVLHVRSIRPFEQWHVTTAEYVDETDIPVVLDTDELEPDAIGYVTLGATSEAKYFHAVGTAREIREIQEKWWRGDLQRLSPE